MKKIMVLGLCLMGLSANAQTPVQESFPIPCMIMDGSKTTLQDSFGKSCGLATSQYAIFGYAIGSDGQIRSSLLGGTCFESSFDAERALQQLQDSGICRK